MTGADDAWTQPGPLLLGMACLFVLFAGGVVLADWLHGRRAPPPRTAADILRDKDSTR